MVVLLPQALAFAAVSEVEPKAELYTAVVVGTVAAALVISYLGKNFKGGCSVKSAMARQNEAATLLCHPLNSQHLLTLMRITRTRFLTKLELKN